MLNVAGEEFMATTTYSFSRYDSTFFGTIRWNRAFQAGLIVGAITFLVPRGIPWVGSGAIDPAIMGREVAPGESSTPLFFFSVMTLHLFLSALYAIILAPIVHGFRNWMAGAVGGVVGLVLYFINYAIAGIIMDMSGVQREWPAIVLHIIFGVVCAETYKGFVRRRPLAPLL
jgi:hypothetical protein